MIRSVTADDLAAILALNNAHAQEVNALTAEGLAALVAAAAHARVVDGGHGFLIALSERAPVQGPNHAWFVARYPRFLYIDRVVIAPQARGSGHARRLYDDLAAVADGRPLCCEVNLVPPNPGSLAFHDRLDFAARGEAIDPRNGKQVATHPRVIFLKIKRRPWRDSRTMRPLNRRSPAPAGLLIWKQRI